MIKIADTFGDTASPYYLRGIEQTFTPIKSGGFADIYQGTFNGQAVALKKLHRFNARPDRTDLFQVCYRVKLTDLSAFKDASAGGVLSGTHDLETAQSSKHHAVPRSRSRDLYSSNNAGVPLDEAWKYSRSHAEYGRPAYLVLGTLQYSASCSLFTFVFDRFTRSRRGWYIFIMKALCMVTFVA